MLFPWGRQRIWQHLKTCVIVTTGKWCGVEARGGDNPPRHRPASYNRISHLAQNVHTSWLGNPNLTQQLHFGIESRTASSISGQETKAHPVPKLYNKCNDGYGPFSRIPTASGNNGEARWPKQRAWKQRCETLDRRTHGQGVWEEGSPLHRTESGIPGLPLATSCRIGHST